MCTRVLWTGNVKGKLSAISGRNMDWAVDMKEKLWVFPVGLKRKSKVDEGEGVEWTSKYGSIAATVYDQGTTDGMNTEGLAVHSNWLTNSYYGERDQSKPGLDGNLALQYYLDQFATVKEVFDDLQKNEDMQFIAPEISMGDLMKPRKVENHVAMEDAKGESIIIEFLEDEGKVQRNIYYSAQPSASTNSYIYNVLTNFPPFKEQMKNLGNYEGFGGTKALPGSSDSADRFVRAAFYLNSLPEPANQREAIAGVLSIMRSTAQPFRVPGKDSYASVTRWRTVADLTEKLYLYESSFYPTLIWLDAKKLDFKEDSGVRVFDVSEKREAIGDVSDKLEYMPDLFDDN